MATNYLMFMEHDEACELVKRRLWSNGFDTEYQLRDVDTDCGIISLIHIRCGQEIYTTLHDIEDGNLPESCYKCMMIAYLNKKNKIEEFIDELRECFDEDEMKITIVDDDNFYLECMHCGEKYYLHEDFTLSDRPENFSCKCRDNIQSEIFPGAGVDFEYYDSLSDYEEFDNYRHIFTCDIETYMDDIFEFDHYFKRTCLSCGKTSVISFESRYDDCPFCNHDNDTWNLELYDEEDGCIKLSCKKCGHILETDFYKYDKLEDEEIKCPECAKQKKLLTGREKCEILRKIREEIAEKNNIIYLTSKCTYKGGCIGTCPKCDAELRYLNGEIRRKKEMGERIYYARIFLDDVMSGKEHLRDNTGMIIEGGCNYMSRKIHSMTIEELDFSIPTFLCLRNAEIYTVEDIINKTEEDLRKVRNLSKKSLEEIIKKLYGLGLVLKRDD